jgi:hypothetical protein
MGFYENEEILKDGKFLIKEYDDRDVFSPSLWLRSNTINQETINIIEKHKLTNVTINDQMGWRGRDSKITFFSKLPKCITGLEIISNSVDVSDISNFKHCERLKFNDGVRGDIDFNSLKNLKVFEARWYENQYQNIDKAASLEVLYLSFYRGKDLTFFSKLKKLKDLNFYLCSNLESLNGIEGLIKLKLFTLDTANKLIDLNCLKNLKGSIKEFNLANCKILNEINPIANVESLKKLYLTGLGKDAVLHDLVKLKNLKKAFIDKKIVPNAGDLIKKYNITLFPLKFIFHD